KSETIGAEPDQPTFRLEFYVDDDGKELVRDWLRNLSLTKKQVLGTAMRQVLQHLGTEVCGTEFGRHLGGGLFEFRVRQKAGGVFKRKRKRLPPEEVLLRVFCHAYGERIVLLLGGYDKAEDPSPKRQSKEIQEARRRLADWRRRRTISPS